MESGLSSGVFDSLDPLSTGNLVRPSASRACICIASSWPATMGRTYREGGPLGITGFGKSTRSTNIGLNMRGDRHRAGQPHQDYLRNPSYVKTAMPSSDRRPRTIVFSNARGRPRNLVVQGLSLPGRGPSGTGHLETRGSVLWVHRESGSDTLGKPPSSFICC